MATADVTIRGAGIFGLSVAWACARRGARVAVIDPAGIGAGASGGVVGALAPHAPGGWNAVKAFQLDSLLMAEAFWAGIEEAGGGSSGYARTGRLQPVADEAALGRARERERSARQLWRGRAEWTLVRACGGWEPGAATGWLIRDTLSALLHPRRALAALAAALRARGVVVAPDGAEAGEVVWATGAAGLRDLGAALGVRAGGGQKGQAALLRCDRAGAPQIFAGGVHVVPHLDGTVAIGSTSEPEPYEAGRVDDRLDAVLARAVAAVPGLASAPVIERWAGERPRAASRMPLLGAWPGRDGHWIANGGFKIGFGIAPKVGEVMAERILEGRDAIPPDFAPEALAVGRAADARA